ncbi:hypothetical protein C0993_010058 [Termitomyces sp. T159_Od127]|nr:hypothetical protein C0993_010058 [Termitomyces sp. T159_Od127]
MDSCSSISSSEGSSSEGTPVVTPTSSFDALIPLPITPQRSNKPLTTPPRLSPKKLQRSPRGRWITADGATRLVFIEDSQEQAEFCGMQDETKHHRIEERELETLLRERDAANREKDEDFVMDVETQTSGTWRDQGSCTDMFEVDAGEALGALSLAPEPCHRGDTELLEDRGITLVAGGSNQSPDSNGTRLPGSVAFMSMDSAQASRVETWRHGVL